MMVCEFVSWDYEIPFHSQLFLESHEKFHGSSHHQPDKEQLQIITESPGFPQASVLCEVCTVGGDAVADDAHLCHHGLPFWGFWDGFLVILGRFRDGFPMILGGLLVILGWISRPFKF